MAHIVMLIHQDGDAYGASFPDFPGATTAAGDLDTLYRKAAEALVFHVEGMVDDEDEVPEPRTIQEMRTDEAFIADSVDALIAVVRVDLPGKSVRVNLSIEESLLRRIDRAAEAVGESRSGFMAHAARVRMAAGA